MKQWLVYKHTSELSGKSYVGLTSKSITVRWQHHCHLARTGSDYHFHRAIRLYGEDNWCHEVIAANINTLEEAQTLEKFFIAQYNTLNNGYNMTYGGETSVNSGIAVKRKEVYEWVHHTHGRRTCTIVALKTEFPYLVHSALSAIADSTKSNKMYRGWQLFVEGATIELGYVEQRKQVYHKDGSTVHMTATEFCNHTGIPRPQVLKMFRGSSNSCGGWSLKVDTLVPRCVKTVYASMNNQQLAEYRSLAECAKCIGVSNKTISNNMVKYGKFIHKDITYSYKVFEENTCIG